MGALAIDDFVKVHRCFPFFGGMCGAFFDISYKWTYILNKQNLLEQRLYNFRIIRIFVLFSPDFMHQPIRRACPVQTPAALVARGAEFAYATGHDLPNINSS